VPALFLARLYPILDVDALARRGLAPLDVIDAWLDAGVALWQLRAKSLPSGPFLELVDAAVHRSRAARARVVVNDRADLARMGDADGVHLGQTDLAPAEARRLLGPAAILGRSTHDEAQTRDACREPISYVAIGPVFGTSSKANPDPLVGLEGVHRAAQLAGDQDLPVVAIGGITLERAAEVLRAGATAVAVIADLLEGDPVRRIALYQRELESLTL
jgi:thiamine-phosphate pyrophosphorylase